MNCYFYDVKIYNKPFLVHRFWSTFHGSMVRYVFILNRFLVKDCPASRLWSNVYGHKVTGTRFRKQIVS